MTRRLVPFLLAALVACGGSGPGTTTASPASSGDVLAAFLDALRNDDLAQMGRLWGSEKGPAAEWMDPEELNKRLTLIRTWLNHSAYRVVEGPTPFPGDARRLTFRVELRRVDCVHVQPFDVVRLNAGGWVVQDVHLGEANSPTRPCQAGSGTPP